jgi:hypothetical protein
MQRVIIPVITRTTGIVARVLKKNLEDIPGKYSVDSLEKRPLRLGHNT